MKRCGKCGIWEAFTKLIRAGERLLREGMDVRLPGMDTIECEDEHACLRRRRMKMAS